VLTLASNSPRRKELLALTGVDYRVAPIEVDETPLAGEAPLAYVLRMAETKALRAAKLEPVRTVILAADTTVADGEQILGKPLDARDAERMLQQLRGRIHQVYTALAVYDLDVPNLVLDWCETMVPMRDYTDAEIRAYIESGDPFDKAGAYAIQHAGFHPVRDLKGCFANVMGLPLCHVVRLLGRLKVEADAGTPQTCQEYLAYHCPIYQQVLAVLD
jgi:septum formation protein